jgi:hypothetical protein
VNLDYIEKTVTTMGDNDDIDELTSADININPNSQQIPRLSET